MAPFTHLPLEMRAISQRLLAYAAPNGWTLARDNLRKLQVTGAVAAERDASIYALDLALADPGVFLTKRTASGERRVA